MHDLGAVMRTRRCARLVALALGTGLMATLVVQAGLLAWYVYQDPPAMNASRYTSYFLRSGSNGSVLQVSTFRSWGAVEAEVSTHAATSPALPTGLDRSWAENEAAVPGALRRIAMEPTPGSSFPVLIRAWGWPWPCFRASCVYRGEWGSSRGLVFKEADSGNVTPSWREFIPTMPWIPGLLANYAVLGLPMALLYAGPRFRRALSTTPVCAGCGYSLAGLPAHAPCPECGYERNQRRRTDGPSPSFKT